MVNEEIWTASQEHIREQNLSKNLGTPFKISISSCGQHLWSLFSVFFLLRTFLDTIWCEMTLWILLFALVKSYLSDTSLPHPFIKEIVVWLLLSLSLSEWCCYFCCLVVNSCMTGATMISEVLKSNSTLTTLSLGGDDKEESKWKMVNEKW